MTTVGSTRPFSRRFPPASPSGSAPEWTLGFWTLPQFPPSEAAAASLALRTISRTSASIFRAS